jgi:2-polyprenyl-3-methyl-5-hydroxy-6-metoxy-1,4-benzoquinol methylase
VAQRYFVSVNETNLQTIPHGNTQRGVNRAVFSFLQSRFSPNGAFSLLDIPCGRGEFALAVKRLFPSSTITCADLHAQAPGAEVRFLSMDATKPFPFSAGELFDVITSISGVMEFDNTAGFISECAKQLKPGGRIVITNDNAFTVRDRLSFLFLGRLRRFKLLMEAHSHTYKYIPPQELLKMFFEQHLTLERVEYVSLYYEDLLFLPLAIVLYPLQWLYLFTLTSSVLRSIRTQLFPFRALLCRHYIIVGKKE